MGAQILTDLSSQRETIKKSKSRVSIYTDGQFHYYD